MKRRLLLVFLAALKIVPSVKQLVPALSVRMVFTSIMLVIFACSVIKIAPSVQTMAHARNANSLIISKLVFVRNVPIIVMRAPLLDPVPNASLAFLGMPLKRNVWRSVLMIAKIVPTLDLALVILAILVFLMMLLGICVMVALLPSVLNAMADSIPAVSVNLAIV